MMKTCVTILNLERQYPLKTVSTPSPPDNSEHGVEVLALSAVQGDLDEVFDGLHPLQGVGFLQDLCGDPKGLLVYHLLKLFQITTSNRGV